MQRPRGERRGLRGSREKKKGRILRVPSPLPTLPFSLLRVFDPCSGSFLLSSLLLSFTKTRSSRNHDRALSFGFETFMANSFFPPLPSHPSSFFFLLFPSLRVLLIAGVNEQLCDCMELSKFSNSNDMNSHEFLGTRKIIYLFVNGIKLIIIKKNSILGISAFFFLFSLRRLIFPIRSK